MATSEVAKQLNDRADAADSIILKLKTQLAALQETAVKDACRKEEERLAQENSQLRDEVNSLVQKLVKLEIRNGVKQIPCSSIPKACTTPAVATEVIGKPKSTVSKPESPKVENNEKNGEPPKKKEKNEKAPKAKAPAKSGDDDKPVDVSRLLIKVGVVVKVETHPDADSLYVETVDVGEEKPRTIISGLVKHITLEEMQNKKALFMCNLKPVKMRGILSEGMIMCASSPEKVEILDIPADCVPGERAICEAYPGEPDVQLNPKKKIWEQVAPDLKVNENQIPTYKGEALVIPGRGIPKAPTLKNVQVK